MKKTVILIIVFLFLLSSCKTVDLDDEAYVDETLTTSKAEQDHNTSEIKESILPKETETTDAEQSDKPITQDTEEKKTDTSETVKEPSDKLATQDTQKQENDTPETFTEQLGEGAEPKITEPMVYHDKVPDKFSSVFDNIENGESHLNEYGHKNYLRLGYGRIEYEGIEYTRLFHEPSQFPANSPKYNSLDFNEIPISDKTVEMEYWIPSPLDGLMPSGNSVIAKLYELPESIANDKYIDVIAVKLPDGKSIVLYSHKICSTLGDLWDMFTEHFGHQWSTSDGIENIKIEFSSDAINAKQLTFELTDRQTIDEMYTLMRQFTMSENSAEINSESFDISMTVNYKNGYFWTFYGVSENKVNYSGYISTQEFTDYLWKTVKAHM